MLTSNYTDNSEDDAQIEWDAAANAIESVFVVFPNRQRCLLMPTSCTAVKYWPSCYKTMTVRKNKGRIALFRDVHGFINDSSALNLC